MASIMIKEFPVSVSSAPTIKPDVSCALTSRVLAMIDTYRSFPKTQPDISAVSDAHSQLPHVSRTAREDDETVLGSSSQEEVFDAKFPALLWDRDKCALRAVQVGHRSQQARPETDQRSTFRWLGTGSTHPDAVTGMDTSDIVAGEGSERSRNMIRAFIFAAPRWRSGMQCGSMFGKSDVHSARGY